MLTMENNIEYVSRKQAADMLGKTERTIDRYASSGVLTVYRMPPTNRYIKFDAAEVKALLVPSKEK